MSKTTGRLKLESHESPHAELILKLANATTNSLVVVLTENEIPAAAFERSKPTKLATRSLFILDFVVGHQSFLGRSAL